MNRRTLLLTGAGALAGAALPVTAARANVPTVPVWNPPASAHMLCKHPALAGALGYNVIVGAGFIPGTKDPDLIIGSNGADQVHADEGDDVVCLGAGDDLGRGGPGDDIIFGESGDDQLVGGPGDDHLFGGPGDDQLVGGPHMAGDTCDGGGGADVLTTCNP